MSDCIFCKIAEGSIPSNKLFADERCFIVADLHPKAATHLLIIPNEHIASIAQMTDNQTPLVSHLVLVAKNFAKQLGLPGYKLLFNVEKTWWQEIMHIHLHLLSDASPLWGDI